jgi:hormone-sensitive lipase
VGSSSGTHQHYLRKWCNLLGFPLFALDYRLAPEYQYPCAHDDIIQAYYWILSYAEKYFRIKPEKIIFVGDSAGGNLALGLYLLAYNYGLKLPDGILLGYPALDISQKLFNPSLILSFKDFALRYSTLKLIFEQYVPTAVNPDEDRFISPIHMNDAEIDALPPVRIMSAGMDPLHDQSFLFALRVAKRHMRIRILEYSNLPHAFWSVEYPGTEETLQKAVELIKDMIALARMKESSIVNFSNILESTVEKVYS